MSNQTSLTCAQIKFCLTLSLTARFFRY